MAWDKNSEMFVIYVVALEALEPAVYSSQALLLAAIQQDKVLTKIPLMYPDYDNILSLDLTMELPENIDINQNAIELVKRKQPSYDSIYSLGLVELETLNTYIKTYLKTGLILFSKSPKVVPILFNKKLDRNLRLCINYRGLNNLIVKNWYPLPLIGKTLDWLDQAN